MKQAIEWLNEVGETVGQAMFCGGNPPGEHVCELIRRIQEDAALKFKKDLANTTAVMKDTEDFLRSVLAVALRRGAETNWEGFSKRTREALTSIQGALGWVKFAVEGGDICTPRTFRLVSDQCKGDPASEIRQAVYRECAEYVLQLHLHLRPDIGAIDALKTAYDNFIMKATP